MEASEAVEDAIRRAIEGVQSIQRIPEESYCCIVLEALETIRSDFSMRLSELEDERQQFDFDDEIGEDTDFDEYSDP